MKGGSFSVSSDLYESQDKYSQKLGQLSKRVGGGQKGGGSDWGFSQYSSGPVNSPQQSESQFRAFNESMDVPTSFTSADIDQALCGKPVDGFSYGDDLFEKSAQDYESVQSGGRKHKRGGRKGGNLLASAAMPQGAASAATLASLLGIHELTKSPKKAGRKAGRKSAKKSGKKVVRKSPKKSGKKVVRKSPKKVVRKSPKKVVRKSPKKSGKKVVRKSPKKSGKKVVRRSPKKVVRKSPKKSGKKVVRRSPKKVVRKSPKKSGKKVVRRSPKKSGKKVVRRSPKKSGKKVVRRSAKRTGRK